jgi:NTE family protein
MSPRPRAARATRRADVVLEGGGVRGTALVGAIAALEDAGYTFHRIAGTSSGALVGALVAAGMPSARLHELVLELDYTRFLDATFWKRLPLPLLDDALAELLDHGLYRGDALHEFVAEQLAGLGVRTFSDLRLDDADIDPAVPPPAATGSSSSPAT